MARTTQRGIDPAIPFAGPTAWATGQNPVKTTTEGTDTTPAITETYIAEVFVPINHLSTGFQVLNGSAVAGNMTAILYDSNGAVITTSASTAQSGTAALQSLAWSAVQNLKGPAKYYVGVQFSSTSARFRSHIIGSFGASKKTGETYGTATTITAPTTFTTGQGPVGSLY